MATHSGQVPTLVITGAHPQLYNHDLAPTAPEGRTWGAFSLFAMWMSDVHSVGGYTFAASLFFLGLTGWQVLISMLVGIMAVYFLMNLIGRPVAALRHPLPGHGPHLLRRDGRQPRRHRARRRRHRLVRRADLFRLEGGAGAGGHARPLGQPTSRTTASSACPRWPGSASSSCGSSSSSSSSAAWSASAGSSISAARSSMS